MKIYKIILLLLLLSKVTLAQENDIDLLKMQQEYKAAGLPVPFGPQPEVGKPMPDFTLSDITYYKAKKASLKDFKGRWLVLDFWHRTCSACIASFPKINKFQQEFGDEIQFMMIAFIDNSEGSFHHYEPTKVLYETLREKRKLSMPCAYESALQERFGIYSAPYMIIIDPTGIVRAITGGNNMTVEKVKALLNGKNPVLDMIDADRVEFKKGINNLNPAPADSSILYQSILAKSNPSFDKYYNPQIDYQLKSESFIRKGYKASNAMLFMMYNNAYFGFPYWDNNDPLYNKVYRRPVLEIRDSSLFNYEGESRVGFNYSLDVPSSQVSKEKLMFIMQRDLENYLNYSATIEVRRMPIYRLVAKPGALEKIKNKGATARSELVDGLGFSVTRCKMSDFLSKIKFSFQNKWIPIFDETNIADRIDITINAEMKDMEAVKKELQKNGLDIVVGEREFKVLVIRDKKPTHIEFSTDNSLRELMSLNGNDSLIINDLIRQNIPKKGNPKWENLKTELQKKYPPIADEVVSRSKVEYFIFKNDWSNFEKSVIFYTEKYKLNIFPEKLKEYAWLLFQHSDNEDAISEADRWRRIYLDDQSTTSQSWYVAANLLYKLGMLMRNNKISANVEGGDTVLKGGLNYMNVMVLKAEPNNKLYQETLVKMEKREPTWPISSTSIKPSKINLNREL
ncbi:TlpA family protein disulfide reductase [Pedobacter frigoris]|uniref:TlpA family protein disulfide reductase n=1 Tax=Pedobacter frigoris TaxID=2571272 RepID=A0A4U1CQ25_9SPHI|nr:TlpA disulfide reductase family protein [Pedobacter frigoris]TKC08980.1 TlpA family protein disulfide reductase [Pedobacter frigoris]